MVYIILLLGFWVVSTLCLELTQELDFSKIKIENLKRLIIRKTANINKNLKIQNFRDSIQKRLNVVRNQVNLNPDEFLAIKELSGCGLFLILWFASRDFLLSFSILIIGFFLPDLWLNENINRKKKKIIKELPALMDMLTLSVEAGLDFQAAINKIVQKSSNTPLIEELKQVQEEIKIGRTREESLHNLTRRIDISEVSSFVSALIQADNMGSPLGPTLRTQSEQMRLTRFLKAEKKAHEAPVKMLFPLIIFIFPVIFIVLFGPVILQIIGY